MRRKTGSKIGWLGWSDSLIAEATGCHWWSTESGEGWQDLLFYVHSSPTVSLSHGMYSYSIFVGHIWDEQWSMINMLKTSIDTAPPPPATLPFTHTKRPKCQNLTRKWFVQKCGGLETASWCQCQLSWCTVLWAQEQCNGTLAAADSFSSSAHWHPVRLRSSLY